MINEIFALSSDVRYVAILRDGQLETKVKEGTAGASGSLIIRYGNFFQFVLPTFWGHVSVCIEKDADPVALGLKVKALFK